MSITTRIADALAAYEARHNRKASAVYLGIDENRELEAWAKEHANIPVSASEIRGARRQFNGVAVFRVDATEYLACS